MIFHPRSAQSRQPASSGKVDFSDRCGKIF
jgi:hypothetical protein